MIIIASPANLKMSSSDFPIDFPIKLLYLVKGKAEVSLIDS